MLVSLIYHIYGIVLLTTPGLTLKRHAQSVGHAISNQHYTPTQLNQPTLPTYLGQPNSPMQFFMGSEHAARTS